MSSLFETTNKAIKQVKMASLMNKDSLRIIKDTNSEVSEVVSKRNLVRDIPMPKATYNSKSIPIKKTGVKLFSLEDEYLCGCFKEMCSTKDADNIKNLRLSKASLKSYLSKRYKSKIAETIVSCFTFSVNWDYNEYFQSLEVFVNNPEESLRKMIFH